MLASQDTIRHGLAGTSDRPLSDAEIKAARLAVECALGEGAVGPSSGLDYIPSRFGGVEEIAPMATPLADASRPYVSHLRAYGADVGVGLSELGNVGRIADSARVAAITIRGTTWPIAFRLFGENPPAARDHRCRRGSAVADGSGPDQAP